MSDGPRCLAVEWPAPPQVRAAFSTREGGVSTGPWAGLNLGTHVGDDPTAVAANRAMLAASLGLAREPWWLEQVHGDTVVRLDGPVPARRGDGAITATPGQVAVVMVADCLPVLLCDRHGREVAAVHAGWRGLAAGIIGRAVACFAAAPGELIAWLGPCIGPRAYAVGAEQRARFVAADARHDAAFVARDGQWFMDLALVARQQLAALGVRSISSAARCVHDDARTFYSYRRDGETGRMAALVWLEPRLI